MVLFKALLYSALLCLSAITLASGEPLFQLNLDSTCMFKPDPENIGEKNEWFSAQLNRNDWRKVESGIFWESYNLPEYDGFGWFAKQFTVNGAASKKIALIITSVDDNAKIWLNGQYIGTHEGANKRVILDVTNKLKNGDNILVLRIQDFGGPGGLNGQLSLQEYTDFNDLRFGPYAKMPARERNLNPDWVREAVIYEVYLRSFSPEGTFAGLENRLPDLKKLGMTVIWVMPIHPVGVEKRKGKLGSPYSVQDFYGINPEFGNLDDFKNLVKAVHAQDMKIIIDLVANHSAWDNKLITDHPDWYTHDENGIIVAPVKDWSDVADFNYDNSELRNYMQDMMIYWVKDIGIDGFRCDVAGMVPVDFWETVRPELEKVKPVLMLAEDENPALHVKAFDLTYGWESYRLLKRILNGKADATQIQKLIDDEFLTYPKQSLLLRFTSNHDENAWNMPAIQAYGSAAGARAAAITVYCLPGVPMLYNGQEASNPEKLGLFEKVSINWEGDQFQMRSFYTDFFNFRKSHPVLIYGDLEFTENGYPTKIVSFQRRYQNEVATVVVNLSDQELTTPFTPASGSNEILFGSAKIKDGSVHLKAFDYVIHLIYRTPGE